MTTLHGAVAVTKTDGIALTITDNLNLDMSGIAEKFFQINGRVAEKRTGFILSNSDGL